VIALATMIVILFPFHTIQANLSIFCVLFSN